MTIEKIYEAYIQSDHYQKDPDLETAVEEMLEDMSTWEIAPGQVEDRIHSILDLQEAAAFRAGFCEAVDFCFQIAALIDGMR